MFVTLRGDRGISSVIRCSFCGKSPNDVRVILTRHESAICDECVFLAFDTIGGQKGYFYQRAAYSTFKLVATIGRCLARCSWRSRSSVDERDTREAVHKVQLYVDTLPTRQS
jgi:hypothetical protein